MKKHINKLNTFLLIIVLLYGYGMLFTAAYYSHPNAEDLSLIGGAKNLGIFKSTYMLLATYDGRYFTNLLHGLNPIALGWVGGYKYTIAFSILFFISSLVLFVKSVYPKIQTFKLILFCSLVVLINFALSPSLVHELYWLVSSYVYLYAWCFWLLWVASYINFMKSKDSKKKSFLYFVTNILLFLALGINEMFLILNLVSLITLVAFHHYKYQFKIKENLPILLTFLLSFFLFVSSPGITSRVDSLEIDASIPEMILSGINGLKHYGSSVAKIFFFNAMVLPVIALIATGFFKLGKVKARFTSIAFLFIAGFTIVYGMTLAYYLLMGVGIDSYPDRIFTSIYTGAIFLVLIGITPLLVERITQLNISPIIIKVGQSISILFLGIGLYFGNNNISMIQQELQTRSIQKYHNEVLQHYKTIAISKDTNNCWTTAVIGDLKSMPKSIFMIPKIKENRSTPFWNNAYEAFFSVDEIRIKNDTITKLENSKNTLLIE